MITVLTESGAVQVPGEVGDALWLSGDDAEQATGWCIKPEGFCRDDVCVPAPAGDEDSYVRGDSVNVSSFWQQMGRPAIASADGDVWFLGAGAEGRNDALLSLEAPDFTLPDFNGKLHSLTDFRRQRVLLITWASW